MTVNEFLDSVMPSLEDPLVRLKREIQEILVDENGHYRQDLSGADVIEQLTIAAEQCDCLTLCAKCGGNGCPDKTPR